MSDRPPNAAATIEAFRAFFEDATIGMAVVDRELRYVYVNRALALRHELPAQAHVGRPVAEIIPQHWERIEPLFRRVLDGETIADAHFSETLAPDSGERRYWVSSYYPLRQDGSVTGIGLLINDVTSLQQAEAALRVRTNMYSMLASTNRVVSICASRDELFRRVCEIAVNEGGFRFAWVGVPYLDTMRVGASAGDDRGYMQAIEDADLRISIDPNDFRSRGPMGQAVLRGVRAVINDFSSATIIAPWREHALRAGLQGSAAFPMRERGRITAVLSLYAGSRNFFTPELVDALGEITPALSTALDRLALEDERAANEAVLLLRDRALNATAEGVLITDARAFDNPVVYANAGFERMTGYSGDEIVGRNCRVLQGEATDPAARATLRRHIAAGESCTVELVNYRRGGEPFLVRLSLSPIFGSTGAVTHFVGVLTDLTRSTGDSLE